MKRMKIGNSDVEVSRVALGTWAVGGGPWWGDGDDNEAIETIQKCIDIGINLIDTAPVYGFGHSEEVVGRAIEKIRDKVIISTKCGLNWDGERGTFHFEMEGKTVDRCLTKNQIKKDVEDSLRRLKTDYIDVLFTHWQSGKDLKTPIAETMEALNELKNEGKIKLIGASNVSGPEIKEYLKHGSLDIIQEKYSILDRKVEQELLPLCKKHNITVQAYSPLEQGVLTGKITREYVAERNSIRERKKWFQPQHQIRAIEMVEAWADLCKKYNCEPSHIAIAWLAAQGENVNVLCGARKVSHMQENAKGIDIELSKEDVAHLRAEAEKIS